MSSQAPAPERTPQHPGPLHLTTDLRVACQRIARRARFESEADLAPHQVAVLGRVSCGPASAGDLAEWEKVSAPTMSRTIAGLVDAGWLTRSDDPEDGRRIILTITPSGMQALSNTRRARDAWMSERLDQLTDAEIDRLEAALPLLERIATS